jgi:hypothetical protein
LFFCLKAWNSRYSSGEMRPSLSSSMASKAHS